MFRSSLVIRSASCAVLIGALAAAAVAGSAAAAPGRQPTAPQPVAAPAPQSAAAPPAVVTAVVAPKNMTAYVLAQPHPQVAPTCTRNGTDLAVSTLLTGHVTGQSTPDTVAAVTCAGATGSTPTEFDVYGLVNSTTYGLIYRVPVLASRQDIVYYDNADVRVIGHVVRMTVLGYRAGDPTAAPTYVYTQDHTFAGRHQTTGPLVAHGN